MTCSNWFISLAPSNVFERYTRACRGGDKRLVEYGGVWRMAAPKPSKDPNCLLDTYTHARTRTLWNPKPPRGNPHDTPLDTGIAGSDSMESLAPPWYPTRHPLCHRNLVDGFHGIPRPPLFHTVCGSVVVGGAVRESADKVVRADGVEELHSGQISSPGIFWPLHYSV